MDDDENIQRQRTMVLRVRGVIRDIVENMDRLHLEDLMGLVLVHRLSGNGRSWNQFLENRDPLYGRIVTCPKSRQSSTIIEFLMSIDLQGGLRVLARFLHHMRAGVDYYIQGEDPRDQPNPDFVPFMDQRFVTKLVGLTLSHPEFPFNYLARSTAQGWVLMVPENCLSIEERPLGTHADIIYLSTDLVRCDDGSLAAIGVCALKRIIQLDETLTNVIVDSYVALDMDRHVIDYNTDLTGLVAEVIEGQETLSVAQVQETLRLSMSPDTVLVGHDLHLHLEALKIQHARVIDTSLLFRFENLDYPLDDDAGAVGLLRRPTLHELVRGWLQKDDFHAGSSDAACYLYKILSMVLKDRDLEAAGDLRIPGPY